MPRSVKIIHPDGVFYDGKTHEKGVVVALPDDLATLYVASGKGEILPADQTGPVMTSDKRIVGVVDPLVPNADPLHAARLGGMVIEEHPGLVAHAEATGAPKRAGRMDPAAVAVVEPIPDIKQAVKPKG